MWAVFEQKTSEEQRKPAKCRTGGTFQTGAARAKALRRSVQGGRRRGQSRAEPGGACWPPKDFGLCSQ